MLKQNVLQKSLIVATMILSVCLVSCGTVKLKDEEYCADKGEIGARCVFDLSGKKQSIDKRDWDEKRFGWICSSPDTFSRRQAALLKFCKDTNRCSEEEVKAIKNVARRMLAITN